MTSAELALGLVGIGRPWPVPERTLPSGEQVNDLLARALALGIRFFDTAAAYGISEQRLGEFLQTLSPVERDGLNVATKCGETWSPEGGSSVDHSRSALAASVARSVELLGRVDLLQLHQASVDVLGDPGVIATLRELRERHGISSLGASVKDPAAADAALALGAFTHVQMPVNATRPDLVAWAREHRDLITIVGNRPFASGQALDHPRDRLTYTAEAVGDGVVLTGTTNAEHLASTVAAWNARSSISR